MTPSTAGYCSFGSSCRAGGPLTRSPLARASRPSNDFPGAGLLAVDEPHLGPRTADGTLRIAPHLHLAELGRERVEREQAAGERCPDPEQELQDLGRLEQPDEPGQDAQHPRLGAGGREVGRRRLGVETAVAWAVARPEGRDLPLEAVDRAVDVRDALQDAGVVEQVAGREVVS